jgi:hypothetical protein
MSNSFGLKYSGGGGGGAGAITCCDDDIGSPAKVTIARETNITPAKAISLFIFVFLHGMNAVRHCLVIKI